MLGGNGISDELRRDSPRGQPGSGQNTYEVTPRLLHALIPGSRADRLQRRSSRRRQSKGR